MRRPLPSGTVAVMRPAAIALCLFLTVPLGVGMAAASPLEKALDHLSARQDAVTGAIGPAGAGQAADTAWAAMAVAGARENPLRWRGRGLSLGDAVAALPGDAIGDLVRLAVARRAVGSLDPTMADRVAAQRSADGGFPGGAVPTAWGVMAFVATGVSADDARVVGAIAALRALQLPDGGWGAAGAAQSDVVSTATAIQALRAAGVPARDPALFAARSRVLALRDPTGTFARAAVPTAWAVLAIRALGERPGRAPWSTGGSPLVALADLQMPDGGVRISARQPSSVFATALAALAWGGHTLPVAPGGVQTPARGPRIVARTPANGDVVRGTLSVRYLDEPGGTGIDPRGSTISVNGVDMTKRARVTPHTLQIRASRLPGGSLAVHVRVRDLAGHSMTADWLVQGPR